MQTRRVLVRSECIGAGTGPFATTAKVAVEDSNGPIKLKREEQIAILFLTAFQTIESDYQNRAKRGCTLDQLVAGPVAADGSPIDRLEFDPKVDPNYAYTLTASGMAWEARAHAKKPACWDSAFCPNAFQ
jgi:hypothetical protein